MIGGRIGRWAMASLMAPKQTDARAAEGDAAAARRAAAILDSFGEPLAERVHDGVVLDYGCGYGHAVMELARRGARTAIGIDIRPAVLAQARQRLDRTDVADRCRFIDNTTPEAVEAWDGSVDAIVSIDAFEHYIEPDRDVRRMADLLRPGGAVFVWFGPPWWHPNGCQMMPFGAPPWSHLLFAERAILDARRRFRDDGAQRFEHVEGGLNRMSVRRFERLVRRSGFELRQLQCRPIRRAAALARLPLGRELFTSVVQAELVKR
jgi:SAM-dependent methyltransferase